MTEPAWHSLSSHPCKFNYWFWIIVTWTQASTYFAYLGTYMIASLLDTLVYLTTYSIYIRQYKHRANYFTCLQWEPHMSSRWKANSEELSHSIQNRATVVIVTQKKWFMLLKPSNHTTDKWHWNAIHNIRNCQFFLGNSILKLYNQPKAMKCQTRLHVSLQVNCFVEKLGIQLSLRSKHDKWKIIVDGVWLTDQNRKYQWWVIPPWNTIAELRREP